jgi:hypothetical protein
VIRNVGAIIAGVVFGSFLNGLIVVAMMGIWPLPEGVDMSDAIAFQAHVATLPLTAWMMAIFAHLTQAGVGGWVAARLGASHPMALALTVGSLSLVGGIINAINLSVPAWVWIEMPLYLAVAAIAGTLENRRRSTL